MFSYDKLQLKKNYTGKNQLTFKDKTLFLFVFFLLERVSFAENSTYIHTAHEDTFKYQ